MRQAAGCLVACRQASLKPTLNRRRIQLGRALRGRGASQIFGNPELVREMGLIKLIARTHTDALSELYDRYSRLAFSLALNLVGDYATAEEITLDVFARVWEKAGTYRSDQAVGPSSPSAGMAMAQYGFHLHTPSQVIQPLASPSSRRVAVLVPPATKSWAVLCNLSLRLSPAAFWRVLLLLCLPRCAGRRRPVGHCYRD
jgi:hypothetical protein